MVQEDNTYVLHGPEPSRPLPNVSLGKLMYDHLLVNVNNSLAMIDAVTGESISYLKILELTCSIAKSLKRNGYGKNTIISISSENNLQFFLPVIACTYIGAIVAPISHMYTEKELLHVLNTTKPQVIFCSKAVSEKFIRLKNFKFHFIEKIIIIDTDDDVYGVETINNFITRSLKGYSLLQRFPIEEIDATKQIAFIMCSSGTTGLPKGVMQTHVSHIVRYMQTIDPKYMTIEENFLGLMPFFHGFGLVTVFFALMMGQKIIVIKKFQEDVFLKTIQDYRFTTLYLAPPLVVLLAKSPLVDKYDLSCVKEILCSAAPLSKETEDAVIKRLNLQCVRQAWGLTEVTLAVTLFRTDDNRAGSSGQVVPYMSCKIRNPETGKSLGPRQVGEICCKGPMVTPGYYKNEEATRNTFTSDGWLLTGDLGYYDEERYFFIVDRLKELIKYKAFQVAPAELEAILLTNSKIKDAGVVGLPDEESGELPLAFVAKNPNVNLTEKEVFDFVAENVSSPKRLRGGVIFVPEIPKSMSGKILRRELRKMLTTHKSKL